MSVTCPICHGSGTTGLMAASGPQKCGVCRGAGKVDGSAFTFEDVTPSAPEPVRFVAIMPWTNRGPYRDNFDFLALDQSGRLWGAWYAEGGGLRWSLLPSPCEPEATEPPAADRRATPRDVPGVDVEGL